MVFRSRFQLSLTLPSTWCVDLLSEPWCGKQLCGCIDMLMLKCSVTGRAATQNHVNKAPVCKVLDTPFTVPELSPTGYFITDLNSTLATDRDNDTLSFAILFGNDEQVCRWRSTPSCAVLLCA